MVSFATGCHNNHGIFFSFPCLINDVHFCILGRSLRLDLSDGDAGKLGYLAGYAAEAGFDWVENTYQKNYIRASIIPDGKSASSISRPLIKTVLGHEQ